MKFTLWDYQIDAVDDVLCNLKKAKKDGTATPTKAISP